MFCLKIFCCLIIVILFLVPSSEYFEWRYWLTFIFCYVMLVKEALRLFVDEYVGRRVIQDVLVERQTLNVEGFYSSGVNKVRDLEYSSQQLSIDSRLRPEGVRGTRVGNDDAVDFFLMLDEELEGYQVSEIERMRKAIEDEKRPLAYILGYELFCGERFIVNAHTLIPRAETEYLVEEVVRAVKDKKVKGERILIDVGTGS